MADVVEPIDAEDAKALIDAGDAVVIDVREPAEIAGDRQGAGRDQHPARANSCAKADPGSPDHEPALQPDKTVILYCASGKRSLVRRATSWSSSAIAKCSNLGGFKDWELAGLPVDEATE